MATAASILAHLDGLAARFEFPGFNNMNYETADSRLHCFRDGERWALVIEELVDWPGADGVMTLVFAMGNVPEETLATLSPLETAIEWDEEAEEQVVPDEVVVRGETIRVDREALDAAVEEHEVEPSFALLLQLIESHRDALFSTADELRARVAPGLVPILKLDEWAHPDVYGGPKPSESEAFRQLAEVLASGNAGAYAPTERANNRDYKMWLESR